MTLKSTLITHLFLSLGLMTSAQHVFAQDKISSSDATLTKARQAYDQGAWDKAISVYKKVHHASKHKGQREVEAALEWSSILWEQGFYEEAKKRAEDTLKIARKIKYDAIIGRLLLTIGHIEASQGRFSTARSTFKICVATIKKSDPVFASLCRMNLALVQKVQGKKGINQKQMEADIARLERVGTPLTAGSALAKTAHLYQEHKDYARAKNLLEQAQKHFVRAKSVPAQARNRLRLATVLQLSHDLAGSRAQLQRALGPLKAMQNRPALVQAYGVMGKNAQLEQKHHEALTHYEHALKIAKRIKSPQWIARSHLALCEFLQGPPHSPKAFMHCAKASTLFHTLKMPDLEVRALLVRARMEQNKGRARHARMHYLTALKILKKRNNPLNQAASTRATTHANLCQVNHTLHVTGTLLSCMQALQELKALSDSAKYTEHIAATYYAAGFAAQREKRIKPALRYFEQSAKAYKEMPQPNHLRVADAYLRMGVIYSVVLRGEANAKNAFIKGLSYAHKDKSAAATSIKTQLLTQLAQVQLEESSFVASVKTLTELLVHAKAHGNHAAQANAYNMLASAKLKLKKRQEAIEALTMGMALIKTDKTQRELYMMMKKNLELLTKK